MRKRGIWISKNLWRNDIKEYGLNSKCFKSEFGCCKGVVAKNYHGNTEAVYEKQLLCYKQNKNFVLSEELALFMPFFSNSNFKSTK